MKIIMQIEPDSEAFEERYSYEMYKIFERAFRVVTDDAMEYGMYSLKDTDEIVIGKLEVAE